jgi:hypothetical protein
VRQLAVVEQAQHDESRAGNTETAAAKWQAESLSLVKASTAPISPNNLFVIPNVKKRTDRGREIRKMCFA